MDRMGFYTVAIDTSSAHTGRGPSSLSREGSHEPYIGANKDLIGSSPPAGGQYSRSILTQEISRSSWLLSLLHETHS